MSNVGSYIYALTNLKASVLPQCFVSSKVCRKNNAYLTNLCKIREHA